MARSDRRGIGRQCKPLPRMAVQAVHGCCHLVASWCNGSSLSARMAASAFKLPSSRVHAALQSRTRAAAGIGAAHRSAPYGHSRAQACRPALLHPAQTSVSISVQQWPARKAQPAPPRPAPPRPCSPHVVGCVQAAHLALWAVGKLVLLGDVIGQAICTRT